MTYETIILDVTDGLASLTINRPNALNAINSTVLTELDRALDEINNNEAIHVVILTGAGDKAFVAGADIKEMADSTPLEAQRFSSLGNSVFTKLAHLKQPVIAAINGYALGGGLELALACDIRIGSTNAIVGLPEVGLGIFPGFGATQRLSRTIGIAKAKEYIWTARNIKADEALKVGLFNQIADPEHLMEAAQTLAQTIMKNAPIAVKQAKTVINEGYDLPLDHALTLEANTFGLLFATADQKEGMAAFVEKRKAHFKNN